MLVLLLALAVCGHVAGWDSLGGDPLAAHSRLPYAVHLALGEGDDEMVVMWHTELPARSATVEYAMLDPAGDGPEQGQGYTGHASARRLLRNGLSLEGEEEGPGTFGRSTVGVSWPFVDGGVKKNTQTLYRVVLTGLEAGRRYKYHVGDAHDGWSLVFTFTAKRSRTQITSDAVRILAYCDMGDEHGLTLPDVQEDVQNHHYDVVMHCGDLAYDLWKGEGQVGVDWMKSIEGVAAYVPYMVSPGNHEQRYNFSHYTQYFTMPQWQKTHNLFYSYDVGNAHIVSYNTEVFFWPEDFDVEAMRTQFLWLEADLKAANANRAQRPWIIVTGHRPMYCVVPAGKKRCDQEHEVSRTGVPAACHAEDEHACLAAPNPIETFPIEDLLYEYGVDVAFFGHVHDYERYYPVYDHEVQINPQDPPGVYTNPRASVHFTTGAGGNPEMPTGTKAPPGGSCHYTPDHWCAFESGYYPTDGASADFSYSHLTVANATHLHWSQWSSTTQRVVDEVWIVQQHHGSFGVPVSKRPGGSRAQR